MFLRSDGQIFTNNIIFLHFSSICRLKLRIYEMERSPSHPSQLLVKLLILLRSEGFMIYKPRRTYFFSLPSAFHLTSTRSLLKFSPVNRPFSHWMIHKALIYYFDEYRKFNQIEAIINNIYLYKKYVEASWFFNVLHPRCSLLPLH